MSGHHLDGLRRAQAPDFTYTGTVKEQATVVYTDILGFSDLVMSMSGAIGLLDGFHYAAMSRAQLRQSFAEKPIPDPLTRTFAAFHRTLDIRISELVNADPIQSIVFSDSAFVVFRDLNTAIYFAQAFMRDLILFRVPARMGIGRGSFRALRLTTDISDEVRRHSSQFLGTGVIRAHQAESCGPERASHLHPPGFGDEGGLAGRSVRRDGRYAAAEDAESRKA
jgi:hypothetical protein